MSGETSQLFQEMMEESDSQSEPEEPLARDDPEEIIKNICELSNSGDDKNNNTPDDINDIFNFSCSSEEEDDDESSASASHEDKKMVYYTEYIDYIRYLENENISVTHIPPVTINSPLSSINKSRLMAKYSYNRISSGSIVRDIITTSCSVISEIFDGTTYIGNFAPNLKGWGDDVVYRFNTDIELKRALNKCAVHIDNPVLSILFHLCVSAASHMKMNSERNKMNTGLSNIRKAAMNLDEI